MQTRTGMRIVNKAKRFEAHGILNPEAVQIISLNSQDGVHNDFDMNNFMVIHSQPNQLNFHRFRCPTAIDQAEIPWIIPFTFMHWKHVSKWKRTNAHITVNHLSNMHDHFSSALCAHISVGQIFSIQNVKIYINEFISIRGTKKCAMPNQYIECFEFSMRLTDPLCCNRIENLLFNADIQTVCFISFCSFKPAH